MYYKVFIKNAEVIISNHVVDGAVVAPEGISVDELYTWVEEQESSNNSIFVQDYYGDFWDEFCSHHKQIEAAGGMVVNVENELLIIKRLGYWDLPKGKLEKAEIPKTGAVREVEEECGISNLIVQEKLPSTWHTYQIKSKKILKKTHWFLMNYAGEENLIPQIEEDITEVKFADPNWVKSNVLNNTYGSLMPLFYTYLTRYK